MGQMPGQGHICMASNPCNHSAEQMTLINFFRYPCLYILTNTRLTGWRCNTDRYLLEEGVDGQGGAFEVGPNSIFLQGEGSLGRPPGLGQTPPLTRRVLPFKENNCHSNMLEHTPVMTEPGHR